MSGAPRPGPDGRFLEDLPDQELWVWLCVWLAQRPALAPVTEPVGPGTQGAAQAGVAAIVSRLDRFADELGALAAAPAPAGSARAVAGSVVRLCRAFTGSWPPATVTTAEQVRQFNGDLRLLTLCLDGIGTRFTEPA